MFFVTKTVIMQNLYTCLYLRCKKGVTNKQKASITICTDHKSMNFGPVKPLQTSQSKLGSSALSNSDTQWLFRFDARTSNTSHLLSILHVTVTEN